MLIVNGIESSATTNLKCRSDEHPFSSYRILSQYYSLCETLTNAATLQLYNKIMTSIESMLTRQLDLRFIDARTLANEARIALGIEGYPSRDEIHRIVGEAVDIFQHKSLDEQQSMQRLHWNLEAIKFPNGAMSRNEESMDSTSEHSSVTSSSASLSSDVSGRRGVMRSLFRR